MSYSGTDDTLRLANLMIKRYGNQDTRNLFKVCDDLIDRLTHDRSFSHHYNKYTITMNVMHTMFPHQPEVVHSYSGFVSTEFQRIRRLEQEERTNHRTSCRCWD